MLEPDMKKIDYKEQTYRIGIPIRVREIEEEISGYHRDYPELFLSEAVPQLLRPELRNGASSNGTAPKVAKAAASGYSKNVVTQRTKSLDILNWIGLAKSRTLDAMRKHGVDMRGIHQLVNNGYLRRQGDAFIRTKKEFLVAKWLSRGVAERMEIVGTPVKVKKAKKGSWALNRHETRTRSAELINSFDTENPKPAPKEHIRSMGSYVRRGYLKQRGRGLYIRTGKVYQVDA
jgi:hypothetical protein